MKLQKIFEKDFTRIHNDFLRDKNLSLSGRGILMTMLSLPEDWNFSIKGLAAILVDGEKSVSSALKDCEKAGYLCRERVTDSSGRVTDWIYYISDQKLPDYVLKRSYKTVNNIVENFVEKAKSTLTKKSKPVSDLGNVVKADVEKSHSNQKINKETNDLINNQSAEAELDEIVEIIKDNVSFDNLCDTYDADRVDETINIIAEAICNSGENVRIGRQNINKEVVKSRFMKLKHEHICYVFDCIDRCTTQIKNIRAYILTSLYNSISTINNFYIAEGRLIN